ncbi:hypothetical protein MXC99_01910 [Thauera aromatica]|uniref:hypothetical protein n=1 Tax=Thauera aromatica TaxID=59405 RepID=UPI001FFDAA11|nr:hypothetical protein [Thauera aromatica]MCK2086944.1 hypothetical protein [Thauera aromatica]
MPTTDNHPDKAAKTSSPLRGKLVRIMTPEERSADMKEFGKEIRKSKASAVAFLQRAGILDETGELAEPYRA